MATQPSSYISPEEYLAHERAAETRSEYYRGEVFAMPGTSLAHNRIVTNLVRELGNQLRTRECDVLSNDMRLLISPTHSYVYPDVMVVCGQPILADHHLDIVTNPVVIVEVLSESTADYDRGSKFHEYRRILSFREYLTISQTEMQIEHWLRQSDDIWQFREIGPPATGVALTTLGIELAFAEIYFKVGL